MLYTTCHAAPELLRGLLMEQICAQGSDVWAVGCVAFTLFTGSNPFDPVKDEDYRKRAQVLHEDWVSAADDFYQCCSHINARSLTCSPLGSNAMYPHMQ